MSREYIIISEDESEPIPTPGQAAAAMRNGRMLATPGRAAAAMNWKPPAMLEASRLSASRMAEAALIQSAAIGNPATVAGERMRAIGHDLERVANHLTKPPAIDYWADVKKWAFSKWWFVPVMLVSIAVPWVTGMSFFLQLLLRLFGARG